MSDSDFFKSSYSLDDALEQQRADLDRAKRMQEEAAKARLEQKKVEAHNAMLSERHDGLKKDLNSFYQKSVNEFQSASQVVRESNGGRALFQVGSGLLQNRPQMPGAEKSGATQGLFTKFIPRTK